MADSLIEQVERWAISDMRVEPGHVSFPERVATGAIAAGLLALSRADRRWRVPVALAAGAALTRAATGVCPVYAALDLPPVSTKTSLSGPRGEHIREHVTIAQPLETVFAFWRSLSSLGAATQGKITVDVIDSTHSRWHLRSGPDQPPLASWSAELINEVPNKVLGWRTTGNPDIVSAGSVTFVQAPGNQGTEVRVHLQYAPPLGRLGTAVAGLSGRSPSAVVRAALADIKRYLEVGYDVVLTA